MPVLRRPLRERRNVQLKVVTSPSKENDIKSTSSQVKHSYIKAKASVRGGRRLRLSNGPGKPSPGSRSTYIPQVIASFEAPKKAAEQGRSKTDAAPAPLSRELNLDLDYDMECENNDPFSTQTPIQGALALSSNPPSPSFFQDVFSLPPDRHSDASSFFSLAYEDPSLYSAGEEDLQSMHEFLPFLFIAFSDGQYTPASLKASYGIDFSHIVKIAYPSLIDNEHPGCISTCVNNKTGVQTLTLTIPFPQSSHSRSSSASSAYGNDLTTSPYRRRLKGRRHARTGVSQRMYTLLTEEQLLAVRDFLSLALPYYLEARPTTRKVANEAVAVLVTAPGCPKTGYDTEDLDGFGLNHGRGGLGDEGTDKGGAADIISAIACYLSFASETPADTVLAYIDEEECLGDEWKDAVSRDEDGVGYIQQVAAM